MNFPTNIKTRIFEIVEQSVAQFVTEDEKKELLTNGYFFIDKDEETELVQSIIDFVNTPEILPIANRNNSFCHPSTINLPNGVVSVRFSMQGSGGDLVDIFEDFILQSVRLLSDAGFSQDLLDEQWSKFQSDFFADEIEIIFYTHLASFYYHAGEIIEDMIPDSNINVRYLHADNSHDKILYYNLRQSVESSFRPVSKEEFLEAGAPIIIEYKKQVNKTDRLKTHFHDAASIFDKITFIIRTICGGSAHFDFIKPIFLGNYATHSELLQNYPSNHLFANTDATTLGTSAPDQTWVTRLWGGIATRDVYEWQFVNQKIRDSYSRVTRSDPHYFFDKTYQLTRQLEKIVDLIQALENTIGDFGTRNAEYVALINAQGDVTRQTQIQNDLTALYSLRNKYIHGKPTGTESVESEFQNSFHGRIKELEEAIKRFEYNFKKIIIVSIMNTDLKQGLHDYHRGQGRNYFDATGRPRRDRHPTVILFPTFNTIYY